MTPLVAWGIVAVGLGLLVRTLRVHGSALRAPVTEARTALRLACALRAGILALATGAAGVALLVDSATLLCIALTIAGEETLETSVVIAALRRDPGVRAIVEPPYRAAV